MPYLQVNNSVAFDKYIFIFRHHENYDLEYFYHMKKLPPTTLPSMVQDIYTLLSFTVN